MKVGFYFVLILAFLYPVTILFSSLIFKTHFIVHPGWFWAQSKKFSNLEQLYGPAGHFIVLAEFIMYPYVCIDYSSLRSKLCFSEMNHMGYTTTHHIYTWSRIKLGEFWDWVGILILILWSLNHLISKIWDWVGMLILILWSLNHLTSKISTLQTLNRIEKRNVGGYLMNIQ